tara:strand:+ start:236 stop:505 length:270 start_codon:yes stop_codon:yes gene_type:complete
MKKYENGVAVEMTEAEVAEHNASLPTESEQIASQWVSVRIQRNAKLSATDWRASSDLTLSDDWKNYRQALRDITTQSDPLNITWPTEPS